MCASTKEKPKTAKSNLYNGIAYSHAYTILGFSYLNGEKLIKLRNPWGYQIWQGFSEQETEILNDILRPDRQNQQDPSKNKGIFYMPWSQFLDIFFDVDVSQVHIESTSTYKQSLQIVSYTYIPQRRNQRLRNISRYKSQDKIRSGIYLPDFVLYKYNVKFFK